MEFWQTILATAAGGAISLFGITISARSQQRSQQAEREAARQHARDDAQRDWIIELQDALLAEVTEAIEHDRRRAERQEYVGDAYEPERIEGEIVRRRGRWASTLMLASRVRDEELRKLAYETVDYVERFYRALPTSDGGEYLLEAANTQRAFNKKSGEVLDLL